MADKTLRINIATDVTELAKIKKELGEVGKIATELTSKTIAPKGDWSAFGGSSAAKEAQKVKDFFDTIDTLQIMQANREKAALEASKFQLQAKLNSDLVMYGNMFTKLSAMEEQAARRAKQASADNRGYVPNTSAIQKGDWSAFGGSSAAIIANTQALKDNGKAAQETERHTRNLFIRVGEAIGSYRIWNGIINTTWDSMRAIPAIGIELESTRASLVATTGSAANMGSTMLALHDEAIRTGIAISTLRESFRGFQASTSLAGSSIESTWHMFTNLNTVITGLHLPMDKANGIFLAMAQIFNKGKVQSEELVKQLGNLLPGAFASMAASMGISGQELSKRMKAGVVLAKDVMENFTTFYAERFAPAFNLAAQGLNANIGRMKTAFTELGETLYSSTSSGMNAVVKAITNSANAINAAINGTTDLTRAFNTGLNIAIAAGVGLLYNAIAGMSLLSTTSVVTATGITQVTLASRALSASLAFISAPATLIAGFTLILLQLTKFVSGARDARESVEAFIKASETPIKAPANPNTLAYKLDNDPQLQEGIKLRDTLINSITILQAKLKEAPRSIGYLSEINKDKAALDILIKKLDIIKEKATVTFKIETEAALVDISSIARQIEIDFKQASGDTIGAAKMMYENQRNTDMENVRKLIEDAKAAVGKSKITNLDINKSLAGSSVATAEDKARAETYIASYNKAIKVVEQYDYVLAHQGQTSAKANAEGKDYLRETEAILDGRLEALDDQAKREVQITEDSLAQLKIAKERNLITEVSYEKAVNEIKASGAIRNNEITKQKIALIEQEIAALDKVTKITENTGNKVPALTKDELNILNSYNKALETNSVIMKGNVANFKNLSMAGGGFVDIAKTTIEELAMQNKEYEASTKTIDNNTKSTIKAADALVRRTELEKKLSALKTQLGTDTKDEENRKKLSDVEIEKLFTSEMEKQINRYNELTQSVRELYIARLKLKGLPQPQIDILVTAFDKATKKEEDNKKYEELKNGLDAYSSSLDTATDKALKFGDIQSAIFDGALGGINTLVGAFETMAKAISENTIEFDKLNVKRLALEKFQPDASKGFTEEYIKAVKMKAGLSDKFDREERELSEQRLQMELRGARQMSEAASKMFGEKTAAGQAFHNISTALAVAEMALEAKKVAVYIAGIIPKLAAGAATMFAQSGWGGFAGVAAMAAVMVGLGVNYATSGGKQSPPKLSEDTGTVLGDKTARSESLSNIAILLDDIHAKEYKELRGINNGIKSLSEAITETITRIFQAGGLPNVNLAPSKLTGIAGGLTAIDPINKMGFDPIGKAILGFLFGGKQTQTITAQGIATGNNKIGDILKGDRFYASYFADIETKTKGGIFSRDKTSFERIFQQMDKDTYTAITHVFKVMGDTMFTVAESLGDGLGDRVKNYIIPAMMIDLKGLSGEDAAKKMNSVISTMLDTMSSKIFGDIIGQYQQLGEGMLETAIRIVSEIAVVKDALGTSGIVLKDNAIAISDALVQAAGGLKEFQAQFETYYEKFYSNAEKQSRLFKQLSESFQDVDSVLPETRRQYRQLLEGLDLTNEADQKRYSLLLSLSEAADTYYETIKRGKDTYYGAFHTDAENQQRLHNQLSTALAGVNVQLPLTRANYRQLVEGLNLSNIEDRKRYFLLLELSGAADNYYRSLEDVAKAQEEAAKAARKKAKQDIEDARETKLARKVSKTDEAFNAYEKQLKTQLDATLKSIEAQKKVAQDIVTRWSNLLSKLSSAKETTVVDTPVTSMIKRVAAEATIALSAEAARNKTAINKKNLEEALTEISKPSEQLYASFAEYALSQAKLGNNIEDISKRGIEKKTDAEKTLATLETSAKAAQEYYTASINAAKAQIDAMRGIKNAVQDLATAIRKEKDVRATIKTKASDLDIYNAYKSSTGVEISAKRFLHFQELAAKGMTTEEMYARIAKSRDARIAKLFEETVGTNITAKKLTKYIKLYEEGATLTDLLEIIKQSNAYKNTHASGLDRVPFDGYQATLHKDEAVIDATSVAAIQRYFKVTPNSGNNNAISEELLAELKLLRKTVEEQGKKLESIDKSSKSSADTLDKSSAGGPLLVQVV